MNIKKIIVILILLLTVLVCSIPSTAFAENPTQSYGSDGYRELPDNPDACKETAEGKLLQGEKIEFKNGSTSKPIYAVYSDDFFESNTGYNHDLARLSLALSLSSWTSGIGGSWCEGKDYEETDVQSSPSEIASARGANIKSAYTDMGFENVELYNYDVNLNDTSDKAAFSIAQKSNVYGSTLISITVRGGNYGGEWHSNFNIGNEKTYHIGFYNSALSIYKQIIKKFESIEGDVKLWITGYSRGAAVANILSAMLCDESIKNEKFDTDDVYAYTFATPLTVVKNSDSSSDVHKGIYNIVNPGDLASTLPFHQWGFTRYGTTKYFSLSEYSESSVNDEIISNVNKSYKSFTGKNFDATANLCQSALNMAFSDLITNSFFSISSSMALQNIMQDITELTYTKTKNENGGSESISISDYHSILSARYGKEYQSAALRARLSMKIQPSAVVASMLSEEWTYLLLTVSEIHGLSSKNFCDLLTDTIKCANNGEGLLSQNNLSQNLQQMKLGHSPQVYLAWMEQDEYQIFRNGSSLNTTVMSIACPVVNVTVYDNDGSVALQIEDNKVIHSELAVISDKENTKIFFPPYSGEDYRVEITATDSVLMNYSVAEFNDSGNPIKQANYNNIQINPAQKFTAEVKAFADFSDEKYDLTTSDQDNKIHISASEILTSNEGLIALYVTVTGDGLIKGEGEYLKGDMADLKAFPAKGYVFSGWYNNERLLSDKAEYSIKITENMVIEAVFKKCEHSLGDEKIKKEATHLETCEAVYICTICQVEITKQIEKISEHTFGDWIIEKEATNSEEGLRRKICECGHSVTEIIPAKNTVVLVIITFAAACAVLGGGFILYRFIFMKKAYCKENEEQEEAEIPIPEESKNDSD